MMSGELTAGRIGEWSGTGGAEASSGAGPPGSVFGVPARRRAPACKVGL